MPSPIADPLPSAAGAAGDAFVSRPDGCRLSVRRQGALLTVHDDRGREQGWWRLDTSGSDPVLEWAGACCDEPGDALLLATIEAAFTELPSCRRLVLGAPLPGDTWLRQAGVVSDEPVSRVVHREAFWQQPRLWLDTPSVPFAMQLALTQGRRHPRRPPKPEGTVYRRHIPWLGTSLSFRTLQIDADLPLFHRWMNDPQVANFWQEQGELNHHRAYLERLAADPHALGLVGCFDERPFGYFETYWAAEDRIAPFCDALDFDRGWHVLVGEPAFRGRPFLTGWMPSIAHYLFLDDCRTERVVIEPRIDNERMLRSLGRCGYAFPKAFDFPHKRAVLGVLTRERFFEQAPWLPQPDASLPPALFRS